MTKEDIIARKTVGSVNLLLYLAILYSVFYGDLPIGRIIAMGLILIVHKLDRVIAAIEGN